MLHVKDLTYKLDKTTILNQVTASFPQQKFIGIIGPNGCGKSTLLKHLYKVIDNKQGCILLDGTELAKLSNHQMAQKLSVVVQEHECCFEFTVEDVVMMGRHARKGLLENTQASDDAIVSQALTHCGLDQSIRNQSFLTLSGGEKQRTLIARALAQHTPCIILDEPTNHLDIKYQLQILNLVKGLDCTVIVAIHDLNIAALYCDELYAMKEGEIVGHGAPKDLITSQFISDIYQVHADVITCDDGNLHILYKSAL